MKIIHSLVLTIAVSMQILIAAEEITNSRAPLEINVGEMQVEMIK